MKTFLRRIGNVPRKFGGGGVRYASPPLRRQFLRARLEIETLENRFAPVAPVAMPDDGTALNFYEMVDNSYLSTDATTGVMQNDQSYAGPGAGATTAVLISGPTVGNLVAFPNGQLLASNGSFTFRAPDNFSGTVTFTYRLEQVINGVVEVSATVPVAINVTNESTIYTPPPGSPTIVDLPTVADGPWTRYQQDGQNTGFLEGATPANYADTIAGGVNLGAPVEGSPILITVNGTGLILVGDASGILHCINAATMTQIWQTTIGTAGSFQTGQAPTLGITNTSPTRVIYVTGYNGTVTALNPLTGAVLWSRLVASYSHLYTSPLILPNVDNGMGMGARGLIAVGADMRQTQTGVGVALGRMIAFRPDGTIAWQTLTSGIIEHGAALDQIIGSLYVAADDGAAPAATQGFLYRINPATGMVWYEYSTSVGTAGAAPTVNPVVGDDFILSPFGNRMIRLIPTTFPDGTLALSFVDQYGASSIINSSAAIVPGSFFTFGDDGGNLWIFNTGGSLRYQVAVSGAINNAPAIISTPAGPMIYFGTISSPGHFYGVNANTGIIIVDLHPGGANTSIDTSSVALTAAGFAYVGGEDGYLYWLV